MAYTLSHIPELLRDLRATANNGRAVLGTVAWSYLRRELIRAAQGACIFSIGLYAAIQPPVPVIGNQVTVTGLFLTGVLFAQGTLVAVASALDWRTRHDITTGLKLEVAEAAEASDA